MFQTKGEKLFSSPPTVFGIVDGILNAGFDERTKEHDETMENVLWVCMHANLKLKQK